jgi:biopolymer transport protein ExbD
MARRPAARKGKIDDKLEDLNLVPIMNLVVCLIPMVLFGASFVKLGVVNVNAPKFGVGSAETEESDEKPLNLTIAISEKGFHISATGAVIPGITAPPEGAEPVDPALAGPTIPKKGEDYDFVDLYNKLVTVKDQFPDESIVNLTADAQIPFKELIRVMDVLRVRLEQDSYNELKEFQSASAKLDADNSPELLWPDVVLAVAQ